MSVSPSLLWGIILAGAAERIRSRASRIGDSEAVLCFCNRISLLLPLTESLAAQIEAP
jgi:hypothetical protein